MGEPVSLTEDAGRALQEAENYCWRTNVGIVAPEHLLAGCLKVLGMVGFPGVPGEAAIEQAILASQGSGEEQLTQDVMFGSAARDALSYTARLVAQAGGGRRGDRHADAGVWRGAVGGSGANVLHVARDVESRDGGGAERRGVVAVRAWTAWFVGEPSPAR